MINSFQDLEVYKRSKKLFAGLTEIVKDFPRDGQYLRTQTLRAANSIHSNIAEGFGRSEKEFKQYLTRALGSNNEVISHLEDAKIAGYIVDGVFDNFLDGYTILGKQLFRLREKWEKFS